MNVKFCPWPIWITKKKIFPFFWWNFFLFLWFSFFLQDYHRNIPYYISTFLQQIKKQIILTNGIAVDALFYCIKLNATHILYRLQTTWNMLKPLKRPHWNTKIPNTIKKQHFWHFFPKERGVFENFENFADVSFSYENINFWWPVKKTIDESTSMLFSQRLNQSFF